VSKCKWENIPGNSFLGFTYSIIKYSFQAEKVAFPYIIRSHEAGAIARLHARQCDKRKITMTTHPVYTSAPVTKAVRSRKGNSLRHYVDQRRVYFAVKRCFDVTVSLLVIVGILSWLTPLLGLLIKWSSPGPVFFLQKRVGRFGKSFTCIKFRTMILNAEADSRQATENDERITAIGKFLRQSNIDELPQFINVLLGHMSIVGPRPHMYADCRQFSAVISGYKFRSLVKPGITGLSQVKGYHGRVISTKCIFKRYQWDVYYVRNASFWYDIKIIATTLFRRLR
jgi:putative colanic acid biosynthesis UDP-glucose lipid carrier transferase